MAIDNKTKIEIDDIIGALTLVDEQHLRHKLCRFVALNPDKLPFYHWRHVLNTFNIVENYFRAINEFTRQSFATNHNSLVSYLQPIRIHSSVFCNQSEFTRQSFATNQNSLVSHLQPIRIHSSVICNQSEFTRQSSAANQAIPRNVMKSSQVLS